METIKNEDGTSERTSSTGSWTPFLMSAAAGVAGSMLMNKLMNRNEPRYYTPPAPQKGQRNLKGIGGYGKTPSEAIKTYQKHNPKEKISQKTTRQENKKSFFKRKQNSQSFFRRKSLSSKRSRLGRRSSSRSGFFRMRGRRR